MVVVEEQDYYYSDSDSDDEDIDRYVFLARQPAPPGRHAEDDDRDASSANDDDDDDDDGGDDGTAGEEESEGGIRKTKKRPLREILDDDDAPPPTKKIIASPLAAQTSPSGSESDLVSSSPRAGESGSEGSHEKAHEHRSPREQGEAKNATKKKRGACGKRSRSPGGEADGGRDDVAAAAAKTAAASSGATATSGRFPCSLCDRCFDSHQALGGHVLGHRKRTNKIAIAAGAILDADVVGEESTAVEVTEEAAKSIAQAEKKDPVAARRGKGNGDGSSGEGKTVDEHGDEDVDRARHKRQKKVHGKGNGGVRKPVFAGSHDDANCNDGFGVSGHGFTDGNSRSHDGKMGAGTCHEGANGNGNGNVCRTRYKCKVCGTECLTGRSLGGHMRKHWKRPPVGGGGGGGGGEERSPSPATDDDCQIPLAQLFGAETSLQRET